MTVTSPPHTLARLSAPHYICLCIFIGQKKRVSEERERVKNNNEGKEERYREENQWERKGKLGQKREKKAHETRRAWVMVQIQQSELFQNLPG